MKNKMDKIHIEILHYTKYTNELDTIVSSVTIESWDRVEKLLKLIVSKGIVLENKIKRVRKGS